MATPSAVFEFSTDGGSTWKASDAPLTGTLALAESGSPIAVKARLSSLAGVNSVTWAVVSADDQSIEAGALPQPTVASDKTATLTVPGTGGRAYVLEALVNGGVLNSTGGSPASLRRRLAVHVKTSAGYEVLAAAEYDEASRLYGWLKSHNDVARAAGSGGGGGGTPAGVAPPAIAAAGAVGTSTNYARQDHTHQGVTSVNGSQGVVTVTVPTASVTTPAAVAAAGAIGSGTTWAKADHVHQGVTSVNGTSGAVTGTFAPTPAGSGDADKVVVANGAGGALALNSIIWPAGARYGSAGSTAADSFGTAPAQSTGDATNSQAFGARANSTTSKGAYALFTSAGVLAGSLLYDGTANDRVELAGEGKAVCVVTAADRSKLTRFEAGSYNVGFAGATAYGTSGEGVIAIGPGTAPTSTPSNTMTIYNTTGNGVVNASGAVILSVGLITRLRVTGAESALVGLVSLGQTGGSFGSAAGTAVFLKNATTNPSANPTGGHVYYAALTTSEPLWRTSGGAVRCAVTAGSSAAAGVYVASASGGSPTTQLNKRTLTFSDGTSFDVYTP